MTLWAVRAPAKRFLQIILISTLLIYQPATTSSCLNVGTVIFGHMDALACCLDHEKYATLIFRRMLNFVVAMPLQQVKGDAYICAFISFVQESARTAVKGAPPTIARSFVTALFDVTGGYLRSYLIPVSREGFYAGNVRFVEVRKLFAFYGDIKEYLHTDGQGWSSPKGRYGIVQNVRSLDISSAEHEVSSCDNFIFNATGVSPDSTGNSVLPIPFFDDNTNPTSVALPLRYGTLHGIENTESAYIILGHYVRSVRCLRERGISSDVFVDYNKKFRSWIVKYVVPRLGDERWYPAFGGILRVLKKTGECVHEQKNSKHVSMKPNVDESRRHKRRKKNINIHNKNVVNRETNSLVQEIADDLIPIDVAILQKLMHSTYEPLVYEINDDNTAYALPAIEYFADTINQKLLDIQKLGNSEDEVSLFFTENPFLTDIESTVQNNDSDLESKTMIFSPSASIKLVRRENKNTASVVDYTSKVTNVGRDSEEKERSDSSTPSAKDFDNLKNKNLKEQELKIKGLTTFKTRKLQTEFQTSASELLHTEHIQSDISLSKKSENNNHVTNNSEQQNEKDFTNIKNEFNIPQKYVSESSRKIIQPPNDIIVKTKIDPKPNVDSMLSEYKFSPEYETYNTHEENDKKTKATMHEAEFPKYNLMYSEITDFRKTTISDISPVKKKSELLVQPALKRPQDDSSFEPVLVKSSVELEGAGSGPWLSSYVFTAYKRGFRNLTDGCVHRTTDGVHAPAPYVARPLANVLQSPAFNLDFIVCHLLLSLFVWLLLFCASAGQDLRPSWRRDEENQDIKYFGGDTAPMPLLYQQTYYSLDGELPKISSEKNSILGRCRETLRGLPIMRYGFSKDSKLMATTEETIPLTNPPSSSTSKSHNVTHPKVVSMKPLDQQLPVHPELQDRRLILLSSEDPVEGNSEGTEVLSENDEGNKLSPELE